MEALFVAVMAVETGGEPDPTKAVGKDGLSFGPAQITDICREDVNRIFGTRFNRMSCANATISGYIFDRYLEHYATKERLGHEPTDEDRARIWNGGPDGWKKECTIDYWRKVKVELTRIEL